MGLHDGGRRLPPRRKPTGYAEMLAAALREEFADRRFAVKTVGRWTGACDRTVKNWFSGASLPNGDHLIALVARSDMALETVLAASRRAEVLDAFFALKRLPNPQYRRNGIVADDPGRVTAHGPNHVTGRRADRETNAAEGRRRWFLTELVAGESVDAVDLRDRFGTSLRTAKRDIAIMKAAGSIRFEGTSRRGWYVLMMSRGSAS